jgi:hypothetical protein
VKMAPRTARHPSASFELSLLLLPGTPTFDRISSCE